ncbi:hypothetical protein AcW1_010046 [Taiwanofungus camphoratus]|nr:hypothetical protein AcV5_002941 [Antrodia cinnamomea]KAI0946627.1 hypothetical protein AcW1_010046 [Antrodia cinnamomea]
MRTSAQKRAARKAKRRMMKAFKAEAHLITFSVSATGQGTHLRWLETEPSKAPRESTSPAPTEIVSRAGSVCVETPEIAATESSPAAGFAEGVKREYMRLKQSRAPRALQRRPLRREQSSLGQSVLNELRAEEIFREQYYKMMKQKEYEEAEWKRAESAGLFGTDSNNHSDIGYGTLASPARVRSRSSSFSQSHYPRFREATPDVAGSKRPEFEEGSSAGKKKETSDYFPFSQWED